MATTAWAGAAVAIPICLAASPYLARLTLTVADRDDATWYRGAAAPSWRRHALTAGIGLVLGALAGRSAGLSALLPAFILLALTSTPLILIDYEHHRLPNRLVYPTAVGAIVLLVIAAASRDDWPGLLRAVEARHAMGDTITGTIFRLSAENVIFYREDLKGLHRDHVLCHELGHVLGGHLDGPAAYQGGPDADLARAAERILHRQCHYGERRELEAERIAELILARVRQQVRGIQDPATERAVRGFGAAMQ